MIDYKAVNEAFNRVYKLNEEENSISSVDNYKDVINELKTALQKAFDLLKANNISDIKTIENSYIQTIQGLFPNKSWWEVTSCNIYWSLFIGHDPEKTIEDIIKGIRIGVKNEIENSVRL